MTKVHVLHLIDGLTFGGAETLLRDLATGLEDRGYRVTVGYSTPGPFVNELAERGVTLKHIPRMALVDPIFLYRMVRLMKSDPPDIVHTHLFKSDFHGRIAARLAGVPIVISTLHNNDVWANNWLLGHIYGATARYADRLIAVSPEVKLFHVEKTGVPEEKVFSIPNGVNISSFEGHDEAGLAVRAEFGITDDMPLFGIVGRLKPQKDLKTFLEATVDVLREEPRARFLVVGDGPLRAELETHAKTLGVQDAVIFTGLRKDIPAVFAALDVLVMSSLWEGLPVVLLEAMAAACPVVSTAVDGIKGVAIDEETALLVPTSDSQALAKACLRFAADAALRESFGKAGRKRVEKRYSLEVMIDRISQHYLDLLALNKIDISGLALPALSEELG